MLKQKVIYPILFCFLSLTCRGQSSNCILTAGQFVELVGATKEKQDNILLACFPVFHSGSDKNSAGEVITFGKYRRDYHPVNGVYDFDMFYVENRPQILFSTTDNDVYKKYLDELGQLGFKPEQAKDFQNPRYVYGKYTMSTGKAKDTANGKTVYIIRMWKSK